MASDDSRPKVRMLLTIGIVSVFLLLGVKFVLDSYYLDMTESYEHSLLPKAELLDQTRAEQRAAINDGQNGAIPVSVAMQTLASKGRDNASSAITPQPSDDIDALKGWAKLKRDVHLPPQVLTVTAPNPPPPATMDGGAPLIAGDAGVMAKDGGPHAAPLTTAKDGGH
jgi:hypothetical protein